MTENKGKRTQKTKRSKKRSKGKSAFKIFSLTVLFLVLTGIVSAAGYAFAIIKSTDKLDVKQIQSFAEPAKFYDIDKNKIDSLITEEKRQKIESEQIPQHLKDAYVAIEDERFYDHQGVDIRRIGGALLHNIKGIFGLTEGLHGASTITQQLIKNTVLTNEQKLERKIREAYLAIQLENELSKDAILTSYLNTIPLGGTAYGVEAASHRYFNKSASELNLIESAYLAGITQAPGSMDAFTEKNTNDPSRIINRTKTVLSKMQELSYISPEEYATAISDLDGNKLVFHYSEPTNNLQYESFTRATVDQVKRDLKEKAGYSEEDIEKLLSQGGLEIYTTMDQDLQKQVQATLDDRSNLGVPGSDEFDEFGTPKLQASAVITDYKNGEVKALVGGRGKRPPASLNRAYSVLKPTGSTVKPLSVYAAAIDSKILTAGSVLDDAPVKSGYMPKNANHRYNGYMSLNAGMASSTNTIAAKVVNKIGTKTAAAYAKKFGIVYNKESEVSVPALALGEFFGASEKYGTEADGANPYILASAFGAFGNDGVVTEGMLYREVKDSTGKVILKAEPTKTQVISPQTAYIMSDMLKGPINTLAPNAKVKNMYTGGKTGTTESNKNYWFSGLTPYYSASVWIGYDQPRSMNGTNSTKTAANIFSKIMNYAHADLPAIDGFEKPAGVVSASYCLDSGMIPTDLCRADQRGNRTATALYIDGTQPKQYCTNHVSVKVNKLNGKLANANTPSVLVENRVFIKKDYVAPGVDVADYKYLLPSGLDDMQNIPSPGTPDDVAPPTEDGTTPPSTDGTTPPPSDGSTTPPTGGTTPPSDNSGSGTGGTGGSEGGTTTPTPPIVPPAAGT